MTKVLCFGSLNIDYIYQVPHFVGAGETLSALSRQRLAGGKGLNQAVALSRAGAQTYMAGSVGEDGDFLLETLQGAGVDISFVRQMEGNTGTAVIQRDGAGENCILLHGGANRCITEEQVQETLEHFTPGDWLVLQNEISCLPLLLREGRKRGMQVVFNPSPMEPDLLGLHLEKVHCLVLNQVEGRQLLGGEEREEEDLRRGLEEWFQGDTLVLTLGSRGAWCLHQGEWVFQKAFSVPVVDTTGAGDAFTGFFVASRMMGQSIPEALKKAAWAAAQTIQHPGSTVPVQAN